MFCYVYGFLVDKHIVKASSGMVLNLIIRPVRTLAHPIVRTEIRSLFTSYYMTNPKNKVGADQVNQSFSPADFIIDPVPISSSISVPYANPRRFGTSVGDEAMWQGLKKTIGHATGRYRIVGVIMLHSRFRQYRLDFSLPFPYSPLSTPPQVWVTVTRNIE